MTNTSAYQSAAAVDTGQFFPANSRVWNRSAFFTVGCISNFTSFVECQQLLDLFTELHTVHEDMLLMVIGDGPEKQEFQTAIEDRGLGKFVTLTGAVKPNELPTLMRHMNAVVEIASDELGSFGEQRVMQYMATGLPVVTTDPAGVVRHNVTGLVSPSESVAAVAVALACLRQAPELALRLGNAARDFVVAHDHLEPQNCHSILGVSDAVTTNRAPDNNLSLSEATW